MPPEDDQQTTPNRAAEENPALKALDEAKQIAQTKKDIAQLEHDTIALQRQTVSAGVPASTQTPLAGETTLGQGAGYLAELVAYQALQRAATEAGDRVRAESVATTGQVKILIVDSLDLAAHSAVLELTRKQIEVIRTALQAQLSAGATLLADAASAEPTEPVAEGEVFPEVAAVGAAVALTGLGTLLGSASTTIAAFGGLAGAAASVAALFRNDYTITAREVALKQDAAKSVMAKVLKGHAAYIAGFQPDATSTLLADLSALIQLRLSLAQNAVALSVHAQNQQDDTGAATKAAFETAAQASTALVTVADEFIKGLTASSADAVPVLTKALTAEQICDARYTHYLYAHVETSGGDTIVEKSLWRSGRTTYLGGCVLNYVLIDRSGRILASDAVSAFAELTTRDGKRPTELEDVVLGAKG